MSDSVPAKINPPKMEEVNLGEEIHAATHEPRETGSQTSPVENAAPPTGPQNVGEVDDGFFDRVKPDGFDERIHATDSNGKPIYTPTGRFKKKPGCNSSTQNEASQKSVAGEVVEDYSDFINPAPPSTIEITAMGFDMLVGLMTKIGGAEMGSTDPERHTMINIYARFIHYKKWDTAAKPEYIVAIATLNFMMPRLMIVMRKRMEAKRRATHALHNNRPNGNGENQPSENNSPSNDGEERSIGFRPLGR